MIFCNKHGRKWEQRERRKNATRWSFRTFFETRCETDPSATARQFHGLHFAVIPFYAARFSSHLTLKSTPSRQTARRLNAPPGTRITGETGQDLTARSRAKRDSYDSRGWLIRRGKFLMEESSGCCDFSVGALQLVCFIASRYNAPLAKTATAILAPSGLHSH